MYQKPLDIVVFDPISTNFIAIKKSLAGVVLSSQGDALASLSRVQTTDELEDRMKSYPAVVIARSTFLPGKSEYITNKLLRFNGDHPYPDVVLLGPEDDRKSYMRPGERISNLDRKVKLYYLADNDTETEKWLKSSVAIALQKRRNFKP